VSFLIGVGAEPDAWRYIPGAPSLGTCGASPAWRQGLSSPYLYQRQSALSTLDARPPPAPAAPRRQNPVRSEYGKRDPTGR